MSDRLGQQQLGPLFREALDAVLVADDQRRYIEANPAACELFALSREELIGRRIDDFIDPGEGFDADAAWAAFLAEGHQQGEFPLRRADGVSRIVEFRARAHVLPGQHLSILHDITERKTGEQMMERFMAILGHDLRSPLQAIGMGAEVLLENAALGARERKVAGLIQSSARRATRMVAELTDLARIRSGGGLSIARAEVDLAAIASAAIDEVQAGHPGSRIELSADGPTRGMWDGDRVAHILTNLLVNAVQHGRAGAPIRVAIEADERAVTLSVENQATPIPAAEVRSLFEPFRRSRGSAGLGLGLFICRELALAHGGEITVRSDEDATVFRVVLPRTVA